MKYKFENTVSSLNEILNVLEDTYGDAADVGFGVEEGIPVIHLRFNGTETTIKEGDTIDSYGVVQDSAQYWNERWHPYPEEKPDAGETVIVNLRGFNTEDFYKYEGEEKGFGHNDKYVSAWAHQPMLYEEDNR